MSGTSAAQGLLDLTGAPDEADDTPDRTIAVDTAPDQDPRIEARLREIFSQVEGLETVSIDVNAGVVVLGGETSAKEPRQKAAHLAGLLEGVVEVRNEIEISRDLRRRLSPVLAELTERLSRLVSALPLLVISLGVFVGLLLLGRILSRWDVLFRRMKSPFVRDLLRQAVQVAFALLGAVFALDVLDATTVVAAIVGIAGLAGLAISFAFQDLVENYIASVLLSIRQPFQSDEHVQIEGHEGQVVRLTSRATILIDLDGNHVRIPNATVFKATIVNYSRNPQRRLTCGLDAPAGLDPNEAIALGRSALMEMPGILREPTPTGWIEERSGDGFALCFTAWIDQRETHWRKARGEALRRIQSALAATESVSASAESDGTGRSDDAQGSATLRPDATVRPDLARHGELVAAVEQDRASAGEDLLGDERPLE